MCVSVCLPREVLTTSIFLPNATRLEGRPADATRLARLLLWIYVLSCVPLSVNLTLFLQKFGL